MFSVSSFLPFLLKVFFPVIVIVYFLFNKKKKDYTYWSSKGIPQITPDVFKSNKKISGKPREEIEFVYKSLRAQGAKGGGVYSRGRPAYVPVDPELLRHIMVKDFEHFRNHDVMPLDEKNNPLGAHLFHLNDDRWRSLRIKLTPTFTSGKMKMMFSSFVSCTNSLDSVLNQYATNREPLDVKEILARFTTDIIGNCAFGIECNSLHNPDEEFRHYGKKYFEFGGMRKFKLVIQRTAPSFLRPYLGKLKFVPQDVEDFFINAVKNIVEYREKNNVFRRDFLHLLLQLKNLGKVTDVEKIKDEHQEKSFFTLNEVAAQCFVFFAAGFETASTTMAFGLYELAKNQVIQQRLREEIHSVLEKYENKVTYEAIQDMKYLDLVIKETLRMYPPVPAIPRKCTKDYKIPGSTGVIEKGTVVQIPAWAIQMDPEYYPKPENFDPERFTKENEATRPHFTYFPFGEGPRQCIGMRFGLLQAKMGITAILRKYKIKPNSQTPTKLGITSDLILTRPKETILLDVQPV